MLGDGILHVFIQYYTDVRSRFTLNPTVKHYFSGLLLINLHFKVLSD